MPSHPDVIVLGVGAMGAAACAALARRGARVLGLERHAPPHALGSSGGQTRLIRKAYYEHPDYVPLLRRAYELWDELGEAVGERLLHRTGLVCAGPPDGPLVAGTREAAARHALPIEDLPPPELARRMPALRLPPEHEALFDPEGGFVLCERAVSAFAREAQRHGARIQPGVHALDWSAGPGGVAVRTATGTQRAARLVLTPGAWAPRLLADLGPTLTVTRQTLGWFAPRDPAPFELGRFPCWAVEDGVGGAEGLFYGFPILPAGLAPGPLGLKCAHHLPGPGVDPDAVERTADAADERALRAGPERYLPSAAGATVAVKICLYTLSPDGHFVLGLHPRHPEVALACGFSGHGFKFAPVIGEALADLALEGHSALPIDFLGLARFA